MRILLTGACGFAGTTLARAFAESGENHKLVGLDNFIRPGSETNRAELTRLGVKLFHGDIRNASDLETLPICDWVIDAAANASVLAGADGRTSSRQLIEHNLVGTINLLEYCKRHQAGFILLSTSRVYAITPLAEMSVEVVDRAFRPSQTASLPTGLSAAGIAENFSTSAPISLYGATKLASETLALEYGETFQFPVFINRCGVLAGASQFGRSDQGIFSFWINSHLQRAPLTYIGFDGLGHQVRDCLHPRDLLPLFTQQMTAPALSANDRVINLSGGAASAISLRQLTDWCANQFGPHAVGTDLRPRRSDLPWVVLDHAKATRLWNWRPQTPLSVILAEIAAHAKSHPDWLQLSAAF